MNHIWQFSYMLYIWFIFRGYRNLKYELFFFLSTDLRNVYKNCCTGCFKYRNSYINEITMKIWILKFQKLCSKLNKKKAIIRSCLNSKLKRTCCIKVHGTCIVGWCRRRGEEPPDKLSRMARRLFNSPCRWTCRMWGIKSLMSMYIYIYHRVPSVHGTLGSVLVLVDQHT